MAGTPNVLVISHNVFSRTGNMGKTMADMLSCVPPNNLAQLYFHSEVPTLDICRRYFRITDYDILKSLFTRKCRFRIYGEKDIQAERTEPRTDSGLLRKIYQFSRRRSPIIYAARNFLWKHGKWESDDLHKWIKEFSPDIIFYASGDYQFSYRIVYDIARLYRIPVVLWCCDDFYLNINKKDSFIKRSVHRSLMKWTGKVAEVTSGMIVISDRMKEDYSVLFEKPISVLHISAEENSLEQSKLSERQGIAYAGRLGVNRYIPLVELGRALKNAKIPGYEYIDVYSGEDNPAVIAQMSLKNGIHFHGFASADEISGLYAKTRYLLHVEAFDEKSKSRTRYSLSTKIGEYLLSGACILAYGPQDIASMQYLSDNKAAVMLDRADAIAKAIQMLNLQPDVYSAYVEAARELAVRNHNKEKNRMIISSILQHAAEKPDEIKREEQNEKE